MPFPIGWHWLQNIIARFTLTAAPGKTPQGNAADGKIDASWLPSVIKSGGGAASTGFQIADGTDLATLFGKLEGASNAVHSSYPANTFLYRAQLGVSGKNVVLTRYYRAAVYCSYCTYCGYCSYCTYCS
jgi:hypothetical protein